MSRNNWCVLAIVSIMFVTLVAAVAVGVAVDKPLPYIIVIGVVGLVAAIGATAYCASEFNLRAHEEPGPVAAAAANATATSNAPVRSHRRRSTPVTPPAPACNVLAWVGAVIATVALVATAFVFWYTDVYHPDTAIRQAAAAANATLLQVP